MTTEPKFKKTLFGMYDKVTALYVYIFTAYNEDDGLRVFHGSAQNPGSALHHNPNDYSLYTLGYLDEETGDITPQQKKCIANKLVIVKPEVQTETQENQNAN